LSLVLPTGVKMQPAERVTNELSWTNLFDEYF